MRHLDDEALSALARREPATEAYFREHLATACEVCELFLASHSGPDLLDGHTDAALLALAPAPSEPRLDEVGFARVRKQLKAAPSEARRWGLITGAVAAALLAVVLVPRLRQTSAGVDLGTESTAPGVKGQVGRIALELAVVARGADGGLRRLDPGTLVETRDVLLLRYHATEAGTALLFQQREGQPPELLGQFALEAGTHDLQGAQGLSGVSLEGESGPLTLWLAASPSGLEPSPDDVMRVLVGEGERWEQGTLAITRFDVRVRSGDNLP
ncbi:hypothetical protein MYSTI_05441 [Myxococcus stipitatus DSM 14675]|uniref:Uncharacterized protein n=1 Tax=Myxococcus stipitatus (strain DSM 14675 / JCM 12634 / Mx s8) TaxID=1278073 RepID=L7UJU3_MYXSD|nr:hypothetical protein [Myxococcus stipitatus]AGC46719.1 hypothetical protein MYSTI_05441 [Myxococcus stipitatus DSM 14675]